MSVQAHPRFLRRRSHVREHGARLHVRRALWVLLIFSAIWAVAWVAQSPLFSVTSIEIEGAGNARVSEVLAEQNVYEGRPLVLIRTGAVEAALIADPWVKEASVQRRFPDRIEIRVTERREVAAVPAARGWRTVSDDGHIMRSVAEPPARLARVGAGVALAAAGGDIVSETMMGVVEFLAALPGEMVGRTVISAEGVLVAVLADERLA